MKDAEKSKHDYSLPPDAPQFVKAKEATQNVSDVSMRFSLVLNYFQIWSNL